LDEERGGDGVGKVAAEDFSGRLGREGFQGIALDQPETKLVFKILF
jgi:hypothetical protein